MAGAITIPPFLDELSRAHEKYFDADSTLVVITKGHLLLTDAFVYTSLWIPNVIVATWYNIVHAKKKIISYSQMLWYYGIMV